MPRHDAAPCGGSGCLCGHARALGLAPPGASTGLPLALPIPNNGPQPQPYGTNDFGGFRNILPPGQNGFDNLTQLGAFEATGQRPAHNDDQLGMYANLVHAVPGLTAAQLPDYFKDATFGVKPGDVESMESPRSDVTIERDKQFGVPHIYGSTRAGTMFGVGYATAEDRLFFIDVLRHVGRSQLSSFAGGAPGNRAFDEEQFAAAPYNEADLTRQVNQFTQLYGADGAQVADDVINYIAGINAYITDARLNPLMMPGEYAAIGRPQGPDDFKPEDLVAIASLVGAIFGNGGGDELGSAQVLEAAQKRFGAKRGKAVWADFREAEDPEAPTTVHDGKTLPLRGTAQARGRGQPRAARRGQLQGHPGQDDQPLVERHGRELGAGERAERPAGVPGRDVERAGGLGRPLGVRPPAGGVRAADRLLRARRS